MLETGLREQRARTLELVAEVSDADLNRVHSPLMSPLVWDLGHIAAFEDLWLVQRCGGRGPLRGDLWEIYDACETPRAERGDLPYLQREEAYAFLEGVRERTLEVLAEGVEDPFLWEMVLQHEAQHGETMLQTLQIAEAGTYNFSRQSAVGRSGVLDVEAGTFVMGHSGEGFAYDNERPAHEVELGAFRIGRGPVTNREFQEFVADGGYARRELWEEAGWTLRLEEGWERPLYWIDDGCERHFDRIEPLVPDAPVMHVSWFEADAFARWCGARLPTEAEWERAAEGNGECWEWTASDFGAYPGFEAFPYREYSEPFFGSTYKVLRGGSWATRPEVARRTFRNWDYPRRRQIFAGFRLAWSY